MSKQLTVRLTPEAMKAVDAHNERTRIPKTWIVSQAVLQVLVKRGAKA